MQPPISPFAMLVALEDDILSNAKGLPFQESSVDTWVGVSFLTGQDVLLTPLDEVVEILPVPLLCPVPGVKSWLRGMVTSRGEVFPVTDLHGFLCGKNSVITHYSRILVIQAQDDTAGLLVDRVIGLQRIACEDQSYDFTKNTSEVAAFMIGSYVNDQVELPIVSCKSILQHPKFRDVAIKEEELHEGRS